MTKNWVAFGYEELSKLPDIKKGDIITCPTCHKEHVVEPFKDDKGKETTTFGYRCGKDLYLAGVEGKCIINTRRRR